MTNSYEFFTTHDSMHVFTVKAGSDTSDLVKVANVGDALIGKRLFWLAILKSSPEMYVAVLETYRGSEDKRIDMIVAINRVHDLSDDFVEYISIF